MWRTDRIAPALAGLGLALLAATPALAQLVALSPGVVRVEDAIEPTEGRFVYEPGHRVQPGDVVWRGSVRSLAPVRLSASPDGRANWGRAGGLVYPVVIDGRPGFCGRAAGGSVFSANDACFEDTNQDGALDRVWRWVQPEPGSGFRVRGVGRDAPLRAPVPVTPAPDAPRMVDEFVLVYAGPEVGLLDELDRAALGTLVFSLYQGPALDTMQGVRTFEVLLAEGDGSRELVDSTRQQAGFAGPLNVRALQLDGSAELSWETDLDPEVLARRAGRKPR